MRFPIVFLLVAGLGMGDTLTLRDGRTVTGSYLGGDARTVRVAVGDHVETFKIDQISNIAFDGPQPPAPQPAQQVDPPPPPPPPPPQTAPAPVQSAAASPAPQADGPVLPSGTALTIRMIDSVDSERDYIGKTYRASLDDPINDANGNPILTRGTDVTVKLVADQQSGKIEGRTALTLSLVSMQIKGKIIDVDSQDVKQESSSRTARSGAVIGGGAALGAIIGAIAGGGKGAAIGAGAGAGAGTVAQVATKGQKVHIPSETRLTFTLQQAVKL